MRVGIIAINLYICWYIMTNLRHQQNFPSFGDLLNYLCHWKPCVVAEVA